MRVFVFVLLLISLCALGACAGKEMEFHPKGQMVLSGNIGK